MVGGSWLRMSISNILKDSSSFVFLCWFCFVVLDKGLGPHYFCTHFLCVCVTVWYVAFVIHYSNEDDSPDTYRTRKYVKLGNRPNSHLGQDT